MKSIAVLLLSTLSRNIFTCLSNYIFPSNILTKSIMGRVIAAARGLEIAIIEGGGLPAFKAFNHGFYRGCKVRVPKMYKGA